MSTRSSIFCLKGWHFWRDTNEPEICFNIGDQKLTLRLDSEKDLKRLIDLRDGLNNAFRYWQVADYTKGQEK